MGQWGARRSPVPSLGPVFLPGNSLGLFPASQLLCAIQGPRRNSEKATSRAGKYRDSCKVMQVCAERGAPTTLGQGCWGHSGPSLATAMYCSLDGPPPGTSPRTEPTPDPHCNKGVCLPGRPHCCLGPGSSCMANTACATSALRCLGAPSA